MLTIRTWLVLLVAFVWGVPAFAAAPTAPSAAVSPTGQGVASAAAATQAAIDSPDYRIGPGDVLQVFVWRNPELSVSVPVRPDGKISTPLINDIVAVGKSPSQLAADMEVVLAEFIRDPKVNIILTSAASVFNQVRVVGQVRAPQALPYREGMTALDALMIVGGLTEFAAGNRSYVLRQGQDGKDAKVKVRLEALVKGSLKENVRLRAGDVLVVPESWF